jgi:3-oxoacyl-[acyl-carrier protein] reductase
MDLQLRGRRALVTGGSQGIGHAVARQLAREGAVVAAAARRIELIEALADEVAREGGTILPIKVDLYEEDGPETLARAASERLGGVDILMNAAGGSRPLEFAASNDQHKWEEGMVLNFFRIRELTHAVIPGMRERKWGRIVHFTGTSEPRMLNAAFAAKAAVHVWAKGLSREVAADNITINSLQPGRIWSEQIRKRYPTPEAEREYAEAEIPMLRFGDPDEIAAIAVFLASERASYVTGTVIPVDGGMSRFAF